MHVLHTYTHIIEGIRLAGVAHSQDVPPPAQAGEAAVDVVHHLLRIA